MKLTGLILAGYRSIHPEKPVVLQDLKLRNVFIGPNNAGKSNLFRFLQQLKLGITNWANDGLKLSLTRSSFWRDESHSILALLEISETLYQNQYTHDGVVRILLRIDGSGPALIVPPGKLSTGGFGELAIPDLENLQSDGSFSAFAKEVLSIFARRLMFFDPVRSLERQPGKNSNHVDDGGHLIKNLYDISKTPARQAEWHLLEKELRSRINALLEPSGAASIDGIRFSVAGNEPYVHVVINDHPFELSSLGTGFAEVLLVIAELIKSKTEPTVFFLEEPESHLHPALLRRFMDQLSVAAGKQFFML